MKQIRFHECVVSSMEESVHSLVEKNYFSDEEYSVQYVREILNYFQLNLCELKAIEAPASFERYCIDTKSLKYVRYRRNAHTTWYAFFEDLEQIYSVVYIANNHQIGHKLVEKQN